MKSTKSPADDGTPKTLALGTRGAFTADPLTSMMLPSRYYTDPTIHEQELAAIFRRSWCYVGHVCDLPQPGDFLTDEIARQPVAIIRGADGVIRTLHNVCQHRGHVLLKGRGNLSGNIVCPYHAWNYGLDCELTGAPMTQNMVNFDRRNFCLPSLPVAVVAGLIFVNLDRQARPFSEEASGFEKTILDVLPGMPDFVATDRMTYSIAANWKIIYDNFSEGYHIPVAHPALAQLHGRKTKAAMIEKRFAFYRGVGRSTFEEFEVQPDEPYLTWQLWPNHCMLSLPGSEHFIILRMDPDGPLRCAERADIYAPAGDQPKNLGIIKRLFAEMFNREDIAIVESVQRGLSSPGFDQGRYVVDKEDGWYSESILHAFHLQVLEALQSTVSNDPVEGSQP
jgi:phenylpropionate dioxygenase-like ring-hydroxylating dioxygenase large terminal subunit